MRHLLAALLLSASSLTAWALPSTYSDVYFFGDSLSDVGNVQNAYAAIPRDPNPPIAPSVALPPGSPANSPGDPYYMGRYSNGPIYADVLAKGLNLPLAPSTAGGNDYAFGGARTGYQPLQPFQNPAEPFLGISAQIAAFGTDHGGGADKSALYVVWGGSNNLQDILTRQSGAPGAGATIDAIILGIQNLYNDGARTFLVPNVPDLTLTPRFRSLLSGLPDAARQAASDSIRNYDSAFAAALNLLETRLFGADIIQFDTFKALNDIVTTPPPGITNTTARCYNGDDQFFTGGPPPCTNPENFVFWDGIHPTSAVHAILGAQMLAALTVPEPGSLALLAIALLALAVGSRRQTAA
jgi:phospholipase/lecithinase/hemolysin